MGTSLVAQTLVFNLPAVHWIQVGSKHVEIHTLGMSVISLSVYRKMYSSRGDLVGVSVDKIFEPILAEPEFSGVPELDFVREASQYWLATPVRDDNDLLCIIHSFALVPPEPTLGIIPQPYYDQLDTTFAHVVRALKSSQVVIGQCPQELRCLCQMQRFRSENSQAILALPTR